MFERGTAIEEFGFMRGDEPPWPEVLLRFIPAHAGDTGSPAPLRRA